MLFLPFSGATMLEVSTNDDKNWAKNNGFEFDIDPNYTGQSFRYLRFVSQRTWLSVRFYMGEIEFWGAYAE